MPRKRLTPQMWIEASFRALMNGGPQAIRAEAIARDLQVSKGSFYWHFKNVADLKMQMLEHWRICATMNIIEEVDRQDLGPKDKLRTLYERVARNEKVLDRSPRIDAAFRDWGRYDAEVADALSDIDQKRIKFLEHLFLESGFNAEVARKNAAVSYDLYVGLGALSINHKVNLHRDLTYLLETLIGAEERQAVPSSAS